MRNNLFINDLIAQSFLGEILTLTFGMSYGIAQIITARISIPSAGLFGSQNELELGQLMPLLLMGLPILAAGEAYHEHKDEARNTRGSGKSSIQVRPTSILQIDYDLIVSSGEILSPSSNNDPSQPGAPNHDGVDTSSSEIPLQVLHTAAETHTTAISPSDHGIVPVERRDTESGLRHTRQRQTSPLAIPEISPAIINSQQVQIPSENEKHMPDRGRFWTHLTGLFISNFVIRLSLGVIVGATSTYSSYGSPMYIIGVWGTLALFGYFYFAWGSSGAKFLLELRERKRRSNEAEPAS